MSQIPLRLIPANPLHLDALVELDQACFGKLWSRSTYEREIDSPNSEIWLLVSDLAPGSASSDLTSLDLTSPNLASPDLASSDLASPEPGSEPGSELRSSQPSEPNIHQETRHKPPQVLGFGCLWCIVDEAHITILGVQPQYRRQGLGEVLLQHLLAIAQRREMARATLEVSTKNEAALALYEQVGFKHAGCRRGYYSNGDDAAILWKSGLQRPETIAALQTWGDQVRSKAAHRGWSIAIPELPEIIALQNF